MTQRHGTCYAQKADRKKFAIVLLVLVALLFIGSTIVEGTGILDKFKLKGDKTKWKVIGINALILGGIVVVVSPFLTNKITDNTQKQMVTVGMAGLALLIVWNLYDASYFPGIPKGGWYLWKMPFIAGFMHLKVLINFGIVFGVIYVIYSTLIEPADFKDKTFTKVVVIGLILLISFQMVPDAKDYISGNTFDSEKYPYIWEHENIVKYRLFLLGDPNCNFDGEYGCYTAVSESEMIETKTTTDKTPGSTEIQGWGVLRGYHLMMLIIGFALFLWLFDTLGVVKEGGNKHINKVISAIIAGVIANSGTDMHTFVNISQIVTFVILLKVFGVKEDLVKAAWTGEGVFSVIIAILKLGGVFWLIATVTGAVGIEAAGGSVGTTVIDSAVNTGVSIIAWGGIIVLAFIASIITAIVTYRSLSGGGP